MPSLAALAAACAAAATAAVAAAQNTQTTSFGGRCGGGSGAPRRVCASLAESSARTWDVGLHAACATVNSGRLHCWGASIPLTALPGRVQQGNVSHVALAAGFANAQTDCSAVGSSLLYRGSMESGQSSMTMTPQQWLGVTSCGYACAVDVTGWTACWMPRSYPGPPVPAVAVAVAPVAMFSHPDLLRCWISPGSLGVSCGFPDPWPCSYPPAGETMASFVEPPPADVGSGQAAVVMTELFACALSLGGNVTCWKLWAAGGTPLTATGSTSCSFGRPNSVVHVSVPPSARTQQVALVAGSHHACALSSAGAVSCWASTVSGGTAWVVNASDLVTPLWVAAERQVAIAAGPHFTCALSVSGRVQCWGPSATWYSATRRAPVSVADVPADLPDDIVDLSAGGGNVCALSRRGTLHCWGNPDLGVNAVPPLVQGAVKVPCEPAAFACPPASPSPTPRASPSPGCAPGRGLTAFAGYDLIGVKTGETLVGSVGECAAACCASAACAGYAVASASLALTGGGAAGAPCVLLANLSQLVPSNFVSSGVRSPANVSTPTS